MRGRWEIIRERRETDATETAREDVMFRAFSCGEGEN